MNQVANDQRRDMALQVVDHADLIGDVKLAEAAERVIAAVEEGRRPEVADMKLVREAYQLAHE